MLSIENSAWQLVSTKQILAIIMIAFIQITI